MVSFCLFFVVSFFGFFYGGGGGGGISSVVLSVLHSSVEADTCTTELTFPKNDYLLNLFVFNLLYAV